MSNEGCKTFCMVLWITMGHFTLAQLGARLGFWAEPEVSHECEHPAARIRKSKPTLKIWAKLCSHWKLRSSSAQARLRNFWAEPRAEPVWNAPSWWSLPGWRINYWYGMAFHRKYVSCHVSLERMCFCVMEEWIMSLILKGFATAALSLKQVFINRPTRNIHLFLIIEDLCYGFKFPCFLERTFILIHQNIIKTCYTARKWNYFTSYKYLSAN